MKIAILGATGGTGRAFVEQALAAGHSLTALVRYPDRARLPAAVRVVVGSATDGAAVRSAVDGEDAVVSCLGAALRRSFGPQGTPGFEGMRVVCPAMTERGVRRLVAVSAMGAAESDTRVGLGFHLLMATVLRGIFRDKNLMEPVIRDSGLDWTIVRPANLKSGGPTGNIEVEPPALGLTSTIARGDVAAFLLRMAGGREYLGQAVIIREGR